MKRLLIIDGNSIAHANHNAMRLTVGDLQVQAIFGFLKSVRLMLERDPKAKPIVLWDGRAQWRIDLYPEYKGNRKPLDAKQAAHKEAFKKQGPLLEYGLECLGVQQLRAPMLEADDLAGHFCRTRQPDTLIKLVSGDQDWLQLVDEGVEWFDPIRDHEVDLGKFAEFTGYKTPRAFLEGKALQGDTSDNISGVGGIGEKGAMELLAYHGSIDELRRKHREAVAMKLNKATNELLVNPEKFALFERNMKLMDLRASPAPKASDLVIKRGAPDAVKFKKFCERLAFASILREMPSFLRAFGIETVVAA